MAQPKVDSTISQEALPKFPPSESLPETKSRDSEPRGNVRSRPPFGSQLFMDNCRSGVRECRPTGRKMRGVAESLLSAFLAVPGPGAAIPKSWTSTDHGLPATRCDSRSAVTVTRGLRRAMFQRNNGLSRSHRGAIWLLSPTSFAILHRGYPQAYPHLPVQRRLCDSRHIHTLHPPAKQCGRSHKLRALRRLRIMRPGQVRLASKMAGFCGFPPFWQENPA
jgi:hypothetical protein